MARHTLRLVSALALTLGSCGSLWRAFNTPNTCGHHDLPCLQTDGGALSSLDMTSPDMATPVRCTPTLQPYWVADSLPGSSGTELLGVTGNGAGEVWVSGGNYIAHRSGTWTPVLGVTTSELSRAAYSPADGQVLILTVNNTHGAIAWVAGDTFAAVQDLPANPGRLTGIWVSPAPERTPYVITSDGRTYYEQTGTATWVISDGLDLVEANAIAGRANGLTPAIWGISDNALAVTPALGVTAATQTATKDPYYAIWVSPDSGGLIWLVGLNGAIGSVVAGSNRELIESQPRPTGATLVDVAGTVGSNHFWAVGSSGTIIHRDSACPIWSVEATPTMNNLRAVWVDDAQKTVWAVGDQGTVLHRNYFIY